MDKAVAVHAIFLIAVIVVLTFFVVAIFFGWLDWTGTGANKFVCSSKLYGYCSDWKKTEFTKTPWDWNKKGPEGCDKFGVVQPSIDDCKKILGTG